MGDSATEATAMAVLATAMARGLLTPRLILLWLRRLWWIWSWLHHWLRSWLRLWGYGKRSADSEADAYYGYGFYCGYGLGYTTGYGLGHGYGGYGGYTTGYGLGYGYGGYGKRSADSEADAYYGYGGYGGYGLGYGGYGY